MTGPITPDAIIQLGLGFWASRTLLSAVELGVFTELGDGPMAGEALARRLGLHPRGARDFLDALVALGMLERDNGAYANTPATGRYLDRARPSYVGGILEMAGTRLYPFWGALTEALRTGRPQNESATGEDVFAALYGDPDRLRRFLGGMTGLSRPAAEALARRFPWETHGSFVDVGTGEGGLPVAVATRHPHLAGGGFDLPPVRAAFEAHVAAHGLADRVRFHPGDFFRDSLPGTEVLVLGHVLHDWGLEDKRRLIAKAHQALPPGGSLVVYDALIDDERRRHAFGLLMSLNMLVETAHGFDYTGADCVTWMREAGFGDARVAPLAGPDSMVIGIKGGCRRPGRTS